MSWVAVQPNGEEVLFSVKPMWRKDVYWGDESFKGKGCWYIGTGYIVIPRGSIKKLIGRDLSLCNEAVELKEE